MLQRKKLNVIHEQLQAKKLEVKEGEEVVDGIKRFFIRNYLLPEAALAECACPLGFDRQQHMRRQQAEGRIVSTVQRKLPKDTFPILECLSLGSGLLLQDFILYAELLFKGYSLNVYFIEPEKNTEAFQKALKQFSILIDAATEAGLTLNIACFDSIWTFARQNPHSKSMLSS